MPGRHEDSTVNSGLPAANSNLSALGTSRPLCSPSSTSMMCISPRPKPLHFTLLTCLLAAFVISLFPQDSRAQLPVIRFARDPDPAPEFKVKDLDGKDLNLEAS